MLEVGTEFWRNAFEGQRCKVVARARDAVFYVTEGNGSKPRVMSRTAAVYLPWFTLERGELREYQANKVEVLQEDYQVSPGLRYPYD